MNKIGNFSSKPVKIFHGSNIEVRNPKILTTGFNKDFGYGFYCTEMRNQSEKWALRKSRVKGFSTVSEFEYKEDKSLNIIKFKEPNEQWIKFIALCRAGLPSFDYDIIEGPMADDTVYNYVTDFIEGRLALKTFLDICRFNKPTHQITFHTDRSLHCLKFIGSYEVRR